MKILSNLEVDVAGLMEANKTFDHPVVRSQYERIFKDNMGGAKIGVASNTEYEVREVSKPGGIMSVRSRNVGNLGTQEEDDLGRWTRVTVVTDAIKLVVYTVYVPGGPDLGGPATIRRQLQHRVDWRGGRCSWKDQLYTDLMGEVGRDISLGYKVVVGGDFNESLERGNMMESKMREFGLVNLVKTRLDPIPSTRVGSRYAIDHV